MSVSLEDDVLAEIRSAEPNILSAVQEEYDQWTQDENGDDEVFGGGGICDAVAARIGEVLSPLGFDIVEGGQDGDDHAFVFAQKHGAVFAVDIHPGHYESGAGYSWVKKPGVVFSSGMLSVEAASYRDVYGEDYRGDNEHDLDARFLSLAANPEANQREMRGILQHFEKQAGVDFFSQELPSSAFMYGMEPDAYLYHVTTADRVDAIYDLGAISPDSRGQFEGAGPRANSKGRVFFTEKGGVRFWCDRIGEQLIHQGRASDDEDEDAYLRVLSVRRDMVQNPQPDCALEMTGAGRDWFTGHCVPIGGDVPLVTFDAQGRVIPPSNRFLPPGRETDIVSLSGPGAPLSVSQGVSYER